jgi:hypothetical protein
LAQAEQVLKDCLNLSTHADIVAHAGKELALRCCKTDPEKYNKEASKKELISPVVFAAAALAGMTERLMHLSMLPAACCRTHQPKLPIARPMSEASASASFKLDCCACIMCTGDVGVEAEYNVHGMLGRGMIDYVILYLHFGIVVIEVNNGGGS